MTMQDVQYFTLTNNKGESVTLSNLGAGIIAINVPDRNGRLDNVSLAYAKGEDYYDDGPFLGKIPGRFANRIAKGRFALNGKEYNLTLNCGTEHLHGGKGDESYANRIWNAEQEGNTVTFSLDSPDGDAGYPGNLSVKAVYKWHDDSCLTLDIYATTDATTVVNLTNHVYFDLRGASRKADCGICNHVLKLNASRYLPTDSNLIPTGEFAPVAGTPMDFTAPKAIGKELHADFPALNYGKGYDACWAVDGFDGNVRPIAELSDPESGRKLVLSTNRPGVQVYTGNWLNGCPDAPDGHVYKDYDGVALECQDFPDSPNRPEFKCGPLEPGRTWHSIIKWQFSAE